MREILDVEPRDFDVIVLAAEKPVLVDFWGTTCGFCKVTADTLAKLAPLVGDELLIAKVNLDNDDVGLAERYAIRAIPHLILFSGGVELDRPGSLMPPRHLLNAVRVPLGLPNEGYDKPAACEVGDLDLDAMASGVDLGDNRGLVLAFLKRTAELTPEQCQFVCDKHVAIADANSELLKSATASGKLEEGIALWRQARKLFEPAILWPELVDSLTNSFIVWLEICELGQSPRTSVEFGAYQPVLDMPLNRQFRNRQELMEVFARRLLHSGPMISRSFRKDAPDSWQLPTLRVRWRQPKGWRSTGLARRSQGQPFRSRSSDVIATGMPRLSSPSKAFSILMSCSANLSD